MGTPTVELKNIHKSFGKNGLRKDWGEGKPNEIFLHPKEERTQRFSNSINRDFSYEI